MRAPRTALAVVVAVLASAPCAPALAAGPGDRLTAAPGLERAVDPDGTAHFPRNAGSAPTDARCLSAWNAHLPVLTRRWLARSAPRPASATVGRFANGGREWRFCAVYVSLDPGRMLVAYLYGASVWKGIVVAPPIADAAQFSSS